MAQKRTSAPRGLRYALLFAIVALMCLQAVMPLYATATVQVSSCPSGCTRPGGHVRISSASDVAVGDEVVINVHLEHFTNLYGVEIEFRYNPALLEVQDDKPGTVGTQIMPGDMPDPEQGFVVQNAVDEGTGTIAYAVALLNPNPPASGSGVLARIRFKALAAGTSTISVKRAMLVASDSCCLEITTQSGTVSAISGTTGSVTGIVRLQGRTNFAGATVSIAGQQATTAADGSFTIMGIAPGSYTISADAPGYLASEKANVVITASIMTNVPQVTLLAGDIDGNCTINVFDLVALGAHYCSSPPGEPLADFNQDNAINIFDLVLLAGNYGRFCPTPWQ